MPPHRFARVPRVASSFACYALLAMVPVGLTACGTRNSDRDQAVADDGIPSACRGVTCADNATCEEQDGAPVCVCDSGFTGDGATACEDIDECDDESAGCSANATCTNSVGGFECACNEGYVGDGVDCDDVDECADETDDCDDDARCTNIDGSFECMCLEGYAGDGRTCADVDECADGTDDCADEAVCENVPGTFDCTCLPGFAGDGVTCLDINECADGTAGCAADATCTNVPGSFMCACNDGFAGDGFTCEDIDECDLGIAGCDMNAACENSPGTFTCTCTEGWAGDGFLCEDVDECEDELDNCDPNATCTNEPGTFSCACNDGFEGDGLMCLDIDECERELDDCDEDFGICTNEPGTFTCECDEGYSGDGVDCDPNFNIELNFVNTPTAAQLAAFVDAEARWENLITGDVPEFTNIRSFCSVPAGTTSIDDLMIRVELVAIDGVGRVLGSAGPRCVRNTMGGTEFLPASGVMRFDTADLANLESSGRLEAVILHEMGHVLGIGTGWRSLGLLDNPSCNPTCDTTPPLIDTTYNGTEAVDAWQDLGGTGDIPVENSIGPGSSDSHWREAGDLATELMSPRLSSTNFLSVITLHAMEDLGYEVGPDSRADTFSLPILIGPPLPETLMSHDIDDGPVWEQLPGGRWRRLR